MTQPQPQPQLSAMSPARAITSSTISLTRTSRVFSITPPFKRLSTCGKRSRLKYGRMTTNTITQLRKRAGHPRRPWHDRENAERYHSFAVTHALYRETSSRLVQLLGLPASARVLDLGCGTGVTTKAILQGAGPTVRVVAVDSSAVQIGVAKDHVSDSRVELLHMAAESMSRRLRGPFDAVVCNAAFWFMKPQPTLAAISGLLAAGGKFAFNVPSRFLPRFETALFSRPRSLPRGEYLHERTLRIARDLGYVRPDAAPAVAYEDLLERAWKAVPLRLVSCEPQVLARTKAEMYAWYRTPVFRASVLPGVDAEIADAIIDRAYREAPAGAAEEESRWINFLYERL